ncbi:hypothetical protein [Mycobacterium conspicuum]|uniref:Uncharacterized protein n=1 Tax=Mycobacterium conspicuum TaxID=44010 RepID=A0A1X1T2F0_9MYCO|nr:hypothetical protein [Mycobacterium conspicuum]ORV38435.1 hypothetical protein AWC00_20170 [Mycobacterium conspicuum]BBZ39751.1 hypothetical protein MCNS_28140 [Mycobacterium conspicuum]
MTTPFSARQLRIAQLAFAGAAAVALLALSYAGRADTPSEVRLAAWTAPGGFATDDTDDQQAQLQQMLQSMQQTEQQNEQAQQQFNQDMQQQQTYENQFNNP